MLLVLRSQYSRAFGMMHLFLTRSWMMICVVPFIGDYSRYKNSIFIGNFNPEGESPLFKEGSWKNRDSVTEPILGWAAVSNRRF